MVAMKCYYADVLFVSWFDYCIDEFILISCMGTNLARKL